MEQVIEITVVCVLGALLTLVLRRGTPEAALLLSLAAAVAAALVLTGSIGEILKFLQNLTDLSGVSDDLFVPLFKTVGIALVVKMGGNLCRDAGESALAATIETAGSVCALLVALPLLQTVLSLLMELME